MSFVLPIAAGRGRHITDVEVRLGVLLCSSGAPARLNRGVDWPVDRKESGFDNRPVGEESWPTSFRCGPQEAQMPPDRRPVAPAFRRPR